MVQIRAGGELHIGGDTIFTHPIPETFVFFINRVYATTIKANCKFTNHKVFIGRTFVGAQRSMGVVTRSLVSLEANRHPSSC